MHHVQGKHLNLEVRHLEERTYEVEGLLPEDIEEAKPHGRLEGWEFVHVLQGLVRRKPPPTAHWCPGDIPKRHKATEAALLALVELEATLDGAQRVLRTPTPVFTPLAIAGKRIPRSARRATRYRFTGDDAGGLKLVRGCFLVAVHIFHGVPHLLFQARMVQRLPHRG